MAQNDSIAGVFYEFSRNKSIIIEHLQNTKTTSAKILETK